MIRYYERERIVPAAARAPNGRRMSDDALIAKLRFVRRSRDLGFSIPEVKALLALSLNETKSCDDAKAIAEKHRDDVLRKIIDWLAPVEWSS
ncbi:MAG: MerR family DNA-binding protein, partial [Boseongicola sp.]|nr:MerR family DNA-binding protein [Boseongicola sp.]